MKKLFSTGEIFIWFTGFGLGITVIMIAGLMFLILIKGSDYYYPVVATGSFLADCITGTFAEGYIIEVVAGGYDTNTHETTFISQVIDKTDLINPPDVVSNPTLFPELSVKDSITNMSWPDLICDDVRPVSSSFFPSAVYQ